VGTTKARETSWEDKQGLRRCLAHAHAWVCVTWAQSVAEDTAGARRQRGACRLAAGMRLGENDPAPGLGARYGGLGGGRR
jgi:hypothetical protein